MPTSEVIKQCSVPFPKDKIKQRKGGHGKMLDYLETASCIRRLNEVFGENWSFSCADLKMTKEGVAIRGCLEYPSSTGLFQKKEQWGYHEVANYPGAAGDAFKSATSDALKKCATLLGIGLHLYEGK